MIKRREEDSPSVETSANFQPFLRDFDDNWHFSPILCYFQTKKTWLIELSLVFIGKTEKIDGFNVFCQIFYCYFSTMQLVL